MAGSLGRLRVVIHVTSRMTVKTKFAATETKRAARRRNDPSRPALGSTTVLGFDSGRKGCCSSATPSNEDRRLPLSSSNCSDMVQIVDLAVKAECRDNGR